MIVECIVMALGLLCFDGVKGPGARNDTCEIPKEPGYLICTQLESCNPVHGVNVAYASETYVKENKVKWCEEVIK